MAVNTTRNETLENPSAIRGIPAVSKWLEDKTFGLGLINISLFVILNVTGILLMFYYAADTGRAYQDIKDLQFVVSFGAIFRNMHRWSAYAMIILVFLHMSRVFYMAEYRKPRELNWVIGWVLFLCTLIASLTGYLLPWDQKAYWGMTIMSNVMASVPIIGEKLKYVVLGGNEIGQYALSRAFDLHVKVMPLLISFVIALHVIRNRTDDLAANPQLCGDAEGSAWSDIISRELAKFFIILIIIMVAAILFGAPLEEEANPSVTPVPATAPWFFLGLQELLSWGAPFWFAIVIPNIVLLFAFVVPYIERGQTGSGVWFHPSRRLQNILFTAFVTVAIGLIILGAFFRGPGWRFFWPWEPWPLH
ncbi:MAG: cytochrome b N-terminal domain-containing protein [Syntrophobacteraceae bacterium]